MSEVINQTKITTNLYKLNKLPLVIFLSIALSSCANPKINQINNIQIKLPETEKSLNIQNYIKGEYLTIDEKKVLIHEAKINPKSFKNISCQTEHKVNNKKLCFNYLILTNNVNMNVEIPIFNSDIDFDKSYIKSLDYYTNLAKEIAKSKYNINLDDIEEKLIISDYTNNLNKVILAENLPFYVELSTQHIKRVLEDKSGTLN
jgi:hypothetical protein